MPEDEQLQYPFDKQVEVKFNVELPGGGAADLVYLDGEPVPHQTSLTIDSDMDFRRLEFAVLHMPSAQEIVVSGYVVPAELLNWYEQYRPGEVEVEEFEPEGFGGYFIEESHMRRITEKLNAASRRDEIELREMASRPGVPRLHTKLRVGA